MKVRISMLALLLSIALFNAVSVLGSVQNTCSSGGMLALTFDDGPSPNMADLLTLLAQSRTKVTFHVVVRYLTDKRLLDLVRKAAQDGHDIGIRSDPALDNNLRQDYVVKSLINNANFLEKALSFRPKFVRLPYGKASGGLVKAIEQSGFIVTEQNMDSADYQSGATVDDIVSAFEMQLGNSPDGAASFISVQRDIVRNSVLAVPQILQVAQENGYKVVKLSSCLGVSGASNKGVPAGDDDSTSLKKGKKGKSKKNKGNVSGKNKKGRGKKGIDGLEHSGGTQSATVAKLMGILLVAAGSLVILL